MMNRGLAGSFRFRSTTRRKRRFSVLCHTTAVYRCRCGSSSRVPRSSKRLKSWKLPFPSYFRRAPRRVGCGPACDINHSERVNLQSTFSTARTAVEEVPETACLLATLRDEGRVMRGDQFRAWVKRRPQHALMKVWPVKRLPKLPGDGAFRVIAVATQVTEVDATA